MTVSTFTQPDYSAQSGSAYKGNIDGAVAVHHRVAGAFAPHAQATPDMTVAVDAGHFYTGAARTEVAAQSTGTITAPTTNPRNDLVVIAKATGAVSVITGAEAASPSDPALTAGHVPIARVSLTVGMTEITNADLDDIRSWLVLAGTAAVQNVGISENNVVQLGAGGALPAVNGAALTGFKGLQGLSLVAGDILYASGVNTLARLAKGTDGQAIVQASGVPSWGNVSAGLNPIERITNSSTPSYDFISGITGDNRTYKLFGWLHPVTDSVSLYVLLSDDGGASFETANYDYFTIYGTSAATTIAAINGNNVAYMRLTTGVGNQSHEHLTFELTINNPASAVYDTQVKLQASYKNASDQTTLAIASGSYKLPAAMNGVRLKFNSGNIDAGDVTLAALANS